MSGHLAAFGPVMANHLWQSTVFAAVVWGLTLLLRRNAARVRYTLWLVASMKFLLPFSLLVGAGAYFARPRAEASVQPRFTVMAEEVAQPLAEFAAPVKVERAPTARRMMRASASPYATLHAETVAAGTESIPGAVVVAGTPDSVSWLEWVRGWLPEGLAAVWLGGLVAVLAVWMLRWRRLERAVRGAAVLEDGREVEAMRRADRSAGLGAVPLLQSRETMEPGVFGVMRPVLLWPEGLSERLEDGHIDAIVAHELEHARRRDNLTAALHMLVEALFWFFPAVWWIERRLVEERERACDEAVVARGGSAETYAESLLRACRFCVESPLVCVAGITGADLSRRIRAIMTLRLERLSWTRRTMLAMTAVAAVAAPVLFGQMHAAMAMSPVKRVEAMLAPARALMDEAGSPAQSAGAGPQEATQGRGGQAAGVDRKFKGAMYDVISGVDPRYPAAAKEAHIEGDVELQGELTQDGHAIGLKAVSGPEALRPAALEAMRAWHEKRNGPEGLRMESEISLNWPLPLRVFVEFDLSGPDRAIPAGDPSMVSLSPLTTEGQPNRDMLRQLYLSSQTMLRDEGRTGAIHLDSGMLAEMKTGGARPVYPEAARRAGVQGDVTVHVLVSPEGKVVSAEPLNGPEALRQAAMDAVKTWTYRRYFLADRPVPVDATVVVSFQQDRTAATATPTEVGKELKGDYQKWVGEDVRWIITDRELAAFWQLKDDEEREAFREAFWQRRGQQAEDEHYRRIAYADANFATANLPGWKSDRGMIYIKFGKPDEVASHPSGGEVVAAGGRQTVTYPFEVWHYRMIAGVGDNVDVEFVDQCRCGEYRMELDKRGGMAATAPTGADYDRLEQFTRLLAVQQGTPAGQQAGQP